MPRKSLEDCAKVNVQIVNDNERLNVITAKFFRIGITPHSNYFPPLQQMNEGRTQNSMPDKQKRVKTGTDTGAIIRQLHPRARSVLASLERGKQTAPRSSLNRRVLIDIELRQLIK